MAFEVRRPLPNRSEANYHVILQANINKEEDYFNIVYAGYADKKHRDEDFKSPLYIDTHTIQGLKKLNSQLNAKGAIEVGYDLLKKHVKCFIAAKKI